MRWIRNRYLWVAVVLLVTAGTAVVFTTTGPEAKPADLRGQILTRMRTALEQTDPGQHNHAGHQVQAAAGGEAPPVVCGVGLYGYEPATVTTLPEVKTVYGYHFCGVAEPQRPFDVAVKLAGPVILDMATDPPGIQVVEATADVKYADRLQQMFPPQYADLATRQALPESEMADLRRRYDDAAGL